MVALLVILVLSARAIARFYTDFLWFQSVQQTAVWRNVLVTKWMLGIVFTVAFFLIMYFNLAIADRLAPKDRVIAPEDELLNRYRELVEPRQRLVRIVFSALCALVAGVGASGQWNSWILFRNGGSFGIKDPLLGSDIGFYIFKLPFLNYVTSWLFASIVIVTLVMGVMHYLNGGIRLQVSGERVSPQVKAHLSVLLAVIALLKAADYVLQRFDLLQSTRGVVTGATYTDVNAQKPAIQLLILISLLSAVLFIINIRRRGWALPVVAVALWLVVAIVAGAIYPWFIQTFQVSRKQSAREAPYIQRNITATRDALGLDHVTEKNFDYQAIPSDQSVTAAQPTITNIRLLDPDVATQAFTNLQSQLSYYQFPDLDVDRYPIGSSKTETEVVISTRQLNPSQLPQNTWEAKHLIYTHGYGIAAAPANAVTNKGRPDFVVSGVAPVSVDPSVKSVLSLKRPELYFGEGIDGPNNDGYAIVDTERQEQGAGLSTSYHGTGGVSISGFIRRAAFYLRTGDLETLTSDYLTSKSKILYIRDVSQRIKTIAPFLQLDGDPYPVVIDGRVKYVVDGYTTSNEYPYAQHADTSQVAQTNDLANVDANYIRNSVKAVVDAYDGTVDLYLSDTLYGQKDPIIRAYAKAFPHLFKPLSAMPKTLRDHLRYPEDLFKIQTAMWGRYHIGDAEDFYAASDQWDVAQDPGRSLSAADNTTLFPRIDPYYLEMQLPGQSNAGFLIFRPFVPHSTDDSKKQLTSFMVGQSDPSDYGKLTMYTMTQEVDGQQQRNRNVDGPLTVNSQMLSTTVDNISAQLSLLNQNGSRVDLGNLLIIPLDHGLMYVRPVYVTASAGASVPTLRKVIVSVGDQVHMGDTLQEAMQLLFPTASFSTQEGGPDQSDTGSSSSPPSGSSSTTTTTSPTNEITPGGGGTTTGTDPQSLLQQALALIQQAQQEINNSTSTTVPATTTTGKA